MTLTLQAVRDALLLRVEKAIAETSERHRVAIYNDDSDEPGGHREFWGGTLGQLRHHLTNESPFAWLDEAMWPLHEYTEDDLDDTPWMHITKPPPLETVERAALRVNGEVWSLPRPARHMHLIHAWCSANRRKPIADHEAGFLTSKGRFVTRAEALELALAAGQVDNVEALRGGATLTSEDLW